MYDGINEMSVEHFLLQSPDYIHENYRAVLTDIAIIMMKSIRIIHIVI